MFCLSYSLSLFGSGSDKDKSILAKKNFENQKQKKITFEKLTKIEREKKEHLDAMKKMLLVIQLNATKWKYIKG